MKKLGYLNLMLVAALFISACGSSTSIVGSYKAPGVTQVAFKKLFVSALTGNAAAKQTVENGISEYLATKNIASVKSIDVFPPDLHSSGGDKDKEIVLKAIRDKNCDGILTIALINKETKPIMYPVQVYIRLLALATMALSVLTGLMVIIAFINQVIMKILKYIT